MGMLLAVSLFSCQQKSNPNFEQGSFTVIHESRGLEVTFKHSKDNASYLEVADLKDEQKLLSLVNLEFAQNKMTYTQLLDFNIKEGKEKSYLLFKGYSLDAQRTSPFAYAIQLNGSKTTASFVTYKPTTSVNGRALAAAASESYSCSAAPCNCCTFIYDPGGTMGYCRCNDQFVGSGDPCYASGPRRCILYEGGVVKYGQCGGIGYTGPTICSSPYTCRKMNDWYYQCL
jgi:hypothetical protein